MNRERSSRELLEYRASELDSYNLGYFWGPYRACRGRVSAVMRQRYIADEEMFVDYAGQTTGIFDPTTAEVCSAQDRTDPSRPPGRKPSELAPILTGHPA